MTRSQTSLLQRKRFVIWIDQLKGPFDSYLLVAFQIMSSRMQKVPLVFTKVSHLCNLCNIGLSIKRQVRFLEALSIVLYDSETKLLGKNNLRRFSFFKYRCIHSIGRIAWENFDDDWLVWCNKLCSIFWRGIEFEQVTTAGSCLAHAHRTTAQLCSAVRGRYWLAGGSRCRSSQ